MRTTLKMLEAAVWNLNRAARFNPDTAGAFDAFTKTCGSGYGLDVQNLRAAGDRHNRYQLNFYDGKSSGCTNVYGSYSLTIGELYAKVLCMQEALRLTSTGKTA